MKWTKLSDGRSCLPAGTILYLEEAGGYYRITDTPIGFGGSGIIYPAVRLRRWENGWKEDEMNLAVKECFPSVPGMVLERDEQGRILGGDNKTYCFALDQMRREKSVTGIIYNSGFRLIPVWTSCEQEQIAVDGIHFTNAANFYAVMERIDEKGRSLEDLAGREKLTAKDIMSLCCQLLRALKEVHDNGFIHGDIQTNNVFVKGYTAGEDLGVVSLLDFGAARRLEADNRTAPVTDRALYTTRGFTPPECLTQNDGMLRLSPAADLYSVGCVLLRMLTGKQISRQVLELVTNGRYLFARQAARLRCPDSAAEAINRFLDKALRKDPLKRYQSADEMLRDASEIEQSLAPANIAIGSSEYAAFISYCHSEKTNLAARMLAVSIERFCIPAFAGGGQNHKKWGRRRLGKVFMDRMELSGGGDMGEQIIHALKHSAYLIVILGGGSEHSRWVAREIEQFLKTHTRDRILTVLADGNETDSMPPVLTSQAFYTEDGVCSLPVESLSADLRSDSVRELKRILHTEKLRLIAPMLGCSFDDLKSREKEARTRSLIRGLSAGLAIFAVIAGIIGIQAFQIRSRNIQLLNIHARELAEKSESFLKNGDRKQAVFLALEALTGLSENTDMPVCTEARAALQKALYLYRDSDSLTMLKKSVGIMKAYRETAAGSEVFSPNGRLMLVRGTDGSVFVWDLQTGVCVAGPDESGKNVLSRGVLFADFLNDRQLLVLTKDAAIRYPLDLTSFANNTNTEPSDTTVTQSSDITVTKSSGTTVTKSSDITVTKSSDITVTKSSDITVTKSSDIMNTQITEPEAPDMTNITAAAVTGITEAAVPEMTSTTAAAGIMEAAVPEMIASGSSMTWMDEWPDNAPFIGAFNEDRSRIALCCLSPSGITEDGVRQVIPELIVCDTNTMQMIGRVSCFSDPAASVFGYANSLTVSGPVFSPDGAWAALPLANLFKGDVPDSDMPAGALLLLDLTGSQSRIITDPENGFLCCCGADDHSLFACGYSAVSMWELQEMPLKGAAFCIDVSDGTVLWKTPLEGQTKMGSDPMGILLRDNYVIFWGNRQMQVIDRLDGDLLRTLQIRNGIAGVPDTGHQRNDTDYIIAGDRRGNIIVCDPSGGTVSEAGTSIDRNVDHFWYTQSVKYGAMIVSDRKAGDYILLKSSDEPLTAAVSLDGPVTKYFAGTNSAYMLISHGTEPDTLTALDLRSGKWMQDYPGDAEYRFAGPELVFQLKKTEDEKKILQLIDLSSGQALLKKEFDADIRIFFSGNSCGWQKGSDFYLLNKDGERKIELPHETNMKTDPKQYLNEAITNMELTSNMRYLYLYGTRSDNPSVAGSLLYCYDLENSRWESLPSCIENGSPSGTLVLSHDGTTAAWIDDQASSVTIFSAGASETQCEWTVPAVRNAMAAFGPGNRSLFFIAQDGILRSFDTATGKQLAQSKEFYTHLHELRVDSKSGRILLDAVSLEDAAVQGVSGTGAVSVMWLYEETPDGSLCQMSGIDNGIYSFAAERFVSMDSDRGKLFLYDSKEIPLEDLITRGRIILEGSIG